MLTIPGTATYISLFLLRMVVAMVFGTSGVNHLKSPTERAASIGMTVPFTIFIGITELAGAIGLVVGLLTQWVASGLILIMFGAIYKKVVEWKTGFWGERSMGWHYEVLFVSMLLVIVTTGGGRLRLMH